MIIETIILYIHLKMNFVHLIYIIRTIVRRWSLPLIPPIGRAEDYV